ncbi:hypothetical protein SORBI_3005G035500 [Sorghum bicolor]|nr:hypothetical protein SORBI_3005G035500 [Sorghum bicolor]
MDGENGDGKILPINAKMTTDLPPLVERKEYLPLPKWLNDDYKSNIADLEGWKCMEIARADGSGRKDKYYTHRDYAHTFRSKKEVQHFLDTGEVKGKGLLQKKLADDPSGQSSGSRRSTKRTMLLPANNDPPKRPTAYADYLRRPNVGGIFRYSNEDGPPGFL